MSGSSSSKRGWRYFATRLNGDGTETLIHPDLPLENVTIEDVLSGDGAIQGQIDPVYTNTLGDDGLPIIREWSTAIYAEADGEIRQGAIVNHCSVDGPNLAIEAVSFTGYGRDMPYTGTGYLGVNVDTLDVVRTIWSHIQGQAGGNIGLQLSTKKSGTLVGNPLKEVSFTTSSGQLVTFEAGPYKLAWYTDFNLQGNVDTLAESGFDYHETHTWQPDGTIKHFLDFGVPKIGRKREDLRFVYGVNIFENVNVERDGSLYASGTLVLGAGTGPSQIFSISEPPSRPDGRLRRIAVVSDNTIKSKGAALARAAIENQWRRNLDDITSVTVFDHPNAQLGAVQVGDEIRIEGQSDWQTIDMWVRVVSIAYQPENGKTAEYTVVRSDKMHS